MTITTARNVPQNARFYTRRRFAEIKDFADHTRHAAELETQAALGLLCEWRCAITCQSRDGDGNRADASPLDARITHGDDDA